MGTLGALDPYLIKKILIVYQGGGSLDDDDDFSVNLNLMKEINMSWRIRENKIRRRIEDDDLGKDLFVNDDGKGNFISNISLK